ncbi:Lsr2 dimerization domain-containing protein [Curtobacterium flaccumfaciens]|uniref:Lsr2 dimerization domain-containing protein n=1 Tax=Curtobacterium flaccumfaciens TaxID=2035 RepID=UPI00112E6AB8|nr:histone-like nucleoid-structuring protein Lsr2 [Curtobacterium flaccumfaciens]TPG05142.1 Lsr2 family protein [Curtobacterium flaccumfaciens]
MAERIITEIIDDIDGSTIIDGNGRAIAFSVDGRAYEIDLNGANADKFEATLSPYIAAARLVTTPCGATSSSKVAEQGDELTRIRRWAHRNGFTIPVDGSINLEARIAYIAAH